MPNGGHRRADGVGRDAGYNVPTHQKGAVYRRYCLESLEQDLLDAKDEKRKNKKRIKQLRKKIARELRKG